MDGRWERAQRPDRRRRRYELWCLVLTGLSIIAVATPTDAAEVRYVYDLKGQIVGTVDAAGSAVAFQWDESGNLMGITRRNASDIPGPVGITLVSPDAGRPADPVEIFGKGFSATPAQNTVTFNGVPVPTPDIQEASLNYLRVRVPSSATTGTVRVQVGPDFGDSPGPFTVLSSTPLTITPSQVSLLPTRTQSFTASSPALWAVEGIPGGNVQIGTITTGVTTTAVYTAPSTGPFPRQVTVGAFPPGRPADEADAVVTILAVPVARAGRVSGILSPAPTQANPVAAPRVSGTTSQPPTQASPLTALRVSGNRAPAITGVSPATIPQGSTPVTFTGQGLANPTQLQFLRNGAPDGTISYSNLAASSDTQATATVTVTSAPAGPRVVQITAGDPAMSSTPAGYGANVLQITNP